MSKNPDAPGGMSPEEVAAQNAMVSNMLDNSPSFSEADEIASRLDVPKDWSSADHLRSMAELEVYRKVGTPNKVGTQVFDNVVEALMEQARRQHQDNLDKQPPRPLPGDFTPSGLGLPDSQAPHEDVELQVMHACLHALKQIPTSESLEACMRYLSFRAGVMVQALRQQEIDKATRHKSSKNAASGT